MIDHGSDDLQAKSWGSAELGAYPLAILSSVICLEARVLTRAGFAAIQTSEAGTPPWDHFLSIGSAGTLAESLSCLDSPDLGALAGDDEIVRGRVLRALPRCASLLNRHPALAGVLAVPIRGGAERFGWLCVAQKGGSSEFGEQDERLTQMLAARAGVALASVPSRASRRPNQDRERWLKSVLDQWREGIVVVDENNGVVLQNLAAQAFSSCTLSTKPSADPRSCRISDRSGTPIPIGESPLERAVSRHESTIGFECFARGFSPDAPPLLQSAAPITIDSQPAGALSVLQEMGQVEQQSCEERVLVLGHDLRQPLNVITLAVGMALRSSQSSNSGEHRRALDRIATAAGRLNSLIDRLVER